MKKYDKIVKESLNRAVVPVPLVENKDFFERFYEVFVNCSEEIAGYFVETDLHKQKKLLSESFMFMLAFASHKESNLYLENLARRHSEDELDVRPELYDLWLESLIKVVSEFDPEFDEDVELAWRILMAPGITYMRFFYDKGNRKVY